MPWNEGDESEMGDQGEIKFENIWQKVDWKEEEKEEMIGIYSHRECQEMTKDADFFAL